MTLPLSSAITKGDQIAPGHARSYFDAPYTDRGCDPLGAALIGSMRPTELDTFWTFLRSASDASACEYIQRSLYRTWPALGATVRLHPTLAAELEQLQIIPRVKPYQLEYRQAIHKSLWKAITDLHDGKGMTKAEIAALLGRNGL
jgi:hypothetical protein